MKRVCVFCFYDKEGLVSEYVIYLLEELRKCVDDLFVVSNGYIGKASKQQLKRYTDHIVERENAGLDFGAFRHVVLSVIGEELVWCNDTFFGPFVAMSDIFAQMDNEHSKADWWGLTMVHGDIGTHIQSFFLVFRRRVIREKAILNYLQRKNKPCEELPEAVATFELNLYRFMKEQGYTGVAYSDTHNYSLYGAPYYTIKEYKAPLLKKKCFDNKYGKDDTSNNRRELIRAIRYLDEQKLYDTKMILSYAKRVYGYEYSPNEDAYPSIPYRQYPAFHTKKRTVEDFYKKHNKIYYYGTGWMMKLIWYFLEEYQDKVVGFVISDDQIITQSSFFGRPVYHYSEIPPEAPIAITMWDKNSDTVGDIISPNHPTLFFYGKNAK